MTSILSNDGGDTDTGFGDVLDLAASGDGNAIDGLVAEFEPGLVRFAKGRGVTDPEALVNGVLSDAFASLAKFRGRDRRAFRAYLYQILRRRIADQYRKAYSQPHTVSGLDDDLVSELVDHDASSFDDRLADRDLVEEILDQLTEDQREVLEMRVLTGLSVKETATRTGRSEGAVKSMQRRALSSLRSVVIAIAVVVLGVLGIRAVMNAGEGVVIVDNSPSSSGESGEQSQRPVLEAEVPNEQVEPPDAGALAASEDGAETEEPTETDPAGAANTTADVEPAVTNSGSESTTEVPANANSAATGSATEATEPTGATERAQATESPGNELGPVVDPIPIAPCSVITDGSPSAGEVAFVTYHFTGPYELFKGTSVDIIGPSSESALIPGRYETDKVWDGRKFPFVIGGNMFPEDVFTVKTFLADREIKTDCSISEEVAPMPCKVKTDGTPARGETAMVTYRTPGPYWTLQNKPTRIVGNSGESAMKSGGDATFKSKVERNFVIDGSMFRKDGFEVRTVFADGAGYAVCEIL